MTNKPRENTMPTKSFTVLYKNVDTFVSKSADMTVHTFECSAVDASDAVRQLRVSRMYSVEMLDKRFKSAKMRKSFKVRKFKVVRVYHGDGLHYCTCEYCKKHPDMSPRVTVIPPKQPKWMMRNYFGKKVGGKSRGKSHETVKLYQTKFDSASANTTGGGAVAYNSLKESK